MIESTYDMTADDYKNYVSENGPDVFELLDGKVLFLGKGDELFEASGYYVPLMFIQCPGAHYTDLGVDYAYTFQGGHVELYAPTEYNHDGSFVVYSGEGAKTIYCKKSDVLQVLHSVI